MRDYECFVRQDKRLRDVSVFEKTLCMYLSAISLCMLRTHIMLNYIFTSRKSLYLYHYMFSRLLPERPGGCNDQRMHSLTLWLLECRTHDLTLMAIP